MTTQDKIERAIRKTMNHTGSSYTQNQLVAMCQDLGDRPTVLAVITALTADGTLICTDGLYSHAFL